MITVIQSCCDSVSLLFCLLGSVFSVLSSLLSRLDSSLEESLGRGMGVREMLAWRLPGACLAVAWRLLGRCSIPPLVVICISGPTGGAPFAFEFCKTFFKWRRPINGGAWPKVAILGESKNPNFGHFLRKSIITLHLRNRAT